MKKVIIMGATSGLGKEIAKFYISKGCVVGNAGRRTELLKSLQSLCPDRVHIQPVDVTSADAPAALEKLVRACGGMDLYVHSSGIGFNNPQLTLDAETQTVTTNAVGFTQMIDTAFNYFARQGHGHIAAITSIAGTQGLGAAPAYSATQKYQSTYLTALAQLARVRRRSVRITDIRPGFVRTALIEGGRYPLQMNVEYAARRACRAIERRRRIAVVDWRYAILVACWRLIPRCLWERIPVYGK